MLFTREYDLDALCASSEGVAPQTIHFDQSDVWESEIVKTRVCAGKSFCDEDNGGLIGLTIGGYTFTDERPIALYPGLFMMEERRSGPLTRCGDSPNLVAINTVFDKEVTCAVDSGQPEGLLRPDGWSPSVWERISPASMVFCKITGLSGCSVACRQNLPACNIDAGGTMLGQRRR